MKELSKEATARLACFASVALTAEEARKEFERMKHCLREAAEECEIVCVEMTEALNAEHPELVANLTTAYQEGEFIKDQMMMGKRWPKHDSSLTSYRDILNSVPEEHRSIELQRCLDAWTRYQEVADKINQLYPPPVLFCWNGARLVGPNLYEKFGISVSGA